MGLGYPVYFGWYTTVLRPAHPFGHSGNGRGRRGHGFQHSDSDHPKHAQNVGIHPIEHTVINRRLVIDEHTSVD